ncbi:MAG TPA: glycosyltransferase N-terminal domain-containing protein, partial [Parafilimonas sp.]|nr:glycosyltransferase N-terminal domain-containing protein [Parafilimonas sp.]
MDKIGYILFIKLYPFVAKILSPFNSKAALWVNGRKNILHNINGALEKDKSKKIWMHCASLGEFEQGRPLLEKLKNIYTDYKFVLTFFSPSGYEVKKNSNEADYIFYLPIDSKRSAADFFN